jgi:hypothetical protein
MKIEEEKRFQFFFGRDPLRRTYGSAPPLNLPALPDNGSVMAGDE